MTKNLVNAIHYVLPVLWMASHLAVVGRMVMHGRLNLLYLVPLAALRYRGGVISVNALLEYAIIVRYAIKSNNVIMSQFFSTNMFAGSMQCHWGRGQFYAGVCGPR